ncbi:hypothetical protein K7X08_011683 [Anisodus acutangulus]|uniref:Pentatricopeptide repeat-containing protein n=1 Tax=Anisodus acutangulus TaxID=402998 RepID=A0A9Q1MK10_9SOLA|nr:hypothetical protein K7X08_011683 [Anisodus acutangulus]
MVPEILGSLLHQCSKTKAFRYGVSLHAAAIKSGLQGLVNDGLDYFNTMNEIYGVTPDIEHFSCLIDLLGRAGRLKDAEEYMQRVSEMTYFTELTKCSHSIPTSSVNVEANRGCFGE